MRGRRKTRSFLEPTRSIDAYVGGGLGLISMIALIASVIEAIVKQGQVSLFFGYLQLVSLCFAILGTIFAVVGWKSEDGLPGMKKMILLVDGILLIINVILVVFGVLAIFR